MTLKSVLHRLDVALALEFDELGAEIRRRVSDMDGLAALTRRDDGDVTHDFDQMTESRIIRVLEKSGIGVRISSEEVPDFIVGGAEDFVAIVDPIDGSDMVARGYPLASIAISLVDVDKQVPVYSRLLEIFTSCNFVAHGTIATRNGRRVRPSGVTRLQDAFVVAYCPTPERRMSRATQALLHGTSALLLNYGGPLDIAKVGSGQCDAVVELGKGFPPRDLVPGLHVAMAAGAVACDEHGKPLGIEIERDARQRFVVAASQQLLDEILTSFHN